MTPEEASKRLHFHAQPEAGSFLGMLRPFRGLRQEILQDVISALRASAPILGLDETLPRQLLSALWAISYLGRSWALAPHGMLRANKLINDDEVASLATFLDRFDYGVMMLLEGAGEDEAFPPSGGLSS